MHAAQAAVHYEMLQYLDTLFANTVVTLWNLMVQRFWHGHRGRSWACLEDLLHGNILIGGHALWGRWLGSWRAPLAIWHLIGRPRS